MTKSTWIKVAVFFMLVLGLWWGFRAAGVDLGKINPDRIRNFVLSFGIWAPVVYLLAYGQPIIPLPASVMTITGGLAFGPLWGWLAAVTGATVRACGQFLIAKLLGREAVAKLLKGKMAKLDQKIGQHGFKAVLILRIVPTLPFDMLNYTLGFSRVRFGPYASGTLLGMIPGSFVYVYFGYSLTDPEHIWKLILGVLIIVGLIATQQIWQRRRGAIATRSTNE